MISTKTVFVVGAGASFELNFPLGATLLESIKNALHFRFDFGQPVSGDTVLLEHIKRAALDTGDREMVQKLVNAAHRINESSAGARSIDSVIDENDHEEFVPLVGKLAIAYFIERAEAASKLAVRRGDSDHLDVGRAAGTWLMRFAALVREGVRRSQVAEIFDNVKVITFNYDRSVERYIPYFLASSYGMPLPEAEQLALKLEILHPYGSLGPLPYQAAGTLAFPYGSLPQSGLYRATEQIRTFTEQLGGDELAKIHAALLWARRIVFLGFGFHPSNMRLLTPGDAFPHGTSVFATAYKQPPPAVDAIREAISRMLNKDRAQVELYYHTILSTQNIDANQFMDDFSMWLAG